MERLELYERVGEHFRPYLIKIVTWKQINTMEKKDAIITIGAIALVVLILWWWIEHDKNIQLSALNQQRDSRIRDLEVNNLKLIRELLKGNKTLPDLVKKQLIDLLSSYEVHDPRIAAEIASVVRLIEAQEYEKGVMAIGKIIESILKRKLKKDDGFQSHLKNPDGKKRKDVFAEYIQYAGKIKIFTKAEQHFADSLREYRNEEAHQVGVRRRLNYNIGSMLTGIELIVKCEAYPQAA